MLLAYLNYSNEKNSHPYFTKTKEYVCISVTLLPFQGYKAANGL